MPAALALRTLLRRAWRLRCPACGEGPVFARGFRRAEECRACGRRLDRDEGHWLGGAEVLIAVSWGVGCLVLVPIALLRDLPDGSVHLLGAAHLAFSVAIYRVSRAVFLALDYAVDPSEDGPPRPPGDDDCESSPAPVPGPGVARPPRSRVRIRQESAPV